MCYGEKLKRHLADFKCRELAIGRPGVYRHRGTDYSYHHILPSPHEDQVFTAEARPAAMEFLARHPGKRHRYVHHLNSSQAFAFNLFFPYFSGPPEAAAALLRSLGQGGPLVAWEPEAVPDAEEESNIDMTWLGADGVRTFCEVKLTEGDFGKAADDERHRAKLAGIYGGVLRGHLRPELLEAPAFFAGYQFYRNLWHAARVERSRLLFLLPRANIRLWEILAGLLSGVLPATLERVTAVAMEDVIGTLEADGLCPAPHREYARKLRARYIPAN